MELSVLTGGAPCPPWVEKGRAAAFQDPPPQLTPGAINNTQTPPQRDATVKRLEAGRMIYTCVRRYPPPPS